MEGNAKKRVIPGGGKKVKKKVIPGGALKTRAIPGKTRPKTANPHTERVMISDSQVISKVASDSKFSKTLIEGSGTASTKDSPPAFKLKSSKDKQKSIKLSKDIEVEFLSEQVDAYYEISSEIDEWNWNSKDIIDQLHVFSRALNFETATLALINSDGDKFERLVSRGNYTYPGKNAISFLEEAITAGRLNWGKLIELTSQKNSPYKNWINTEEFEYVGLAPIHDGQDNGLHLHRQQKINTSF